MALNQNSFVRAATPEPYVILGLTLKPFCLGHYVWLRRFGCAYVSTEKTEPTRDDMVFACLVCSMTFDEFNEWIHSAPATLWQRVVEVLRILLCLRSFAPIKPAWNANQAELAVMRWGRKVGLFDIAEKSELFTKYLKEHSALPQFWIEEKNKGQSGGEWAQTVFLTLTGSLGFTKEQAWNMSLSEAFLHFFRNAEKEGAVTLMTDSELEELGA